MVKHRKSKGCTASVHKKGHFVVVKARCHVGKAKVTTPTTCKHMPRKTKQKTGTKHKKVSIPSACKGLKGRSLTECKHIMKKEYYNK